LRRGKSVGTHVLAPRAIQLRNVLLQRIAVRLFLRPPNTKELRELNEAASLTMAVRWWEAQQPNGANVDRLVGVSAMRWWTRVACYVVLLAGLAATLWWLVRT
jgi:hypothetical protein